MILLFLYVINNEFVNFDYQKTKLPVTELVPELRTKLSKGNTLIVNAETGAGKSTLLPLCLFQEDWIKGRKILMLEPRRLAARSIAYRMAELLGEEVGETVGYRIRFEHRSGPNTKIEVLTEGILTRMLHNDNALENVALVIFDEFHERSIHADLALALCREAQQILRPDLRIMVMSATLDMPELSELLNAPVAYSKGRQFAVEIKYTGETDIRLLAEMTAQTITKALQENEGDLLAFLPGQGEIKSCEEILRKSLNNIAIHPLYGMLPQNKQYAALMPDRNGRRKVVLATSIAETSLTIEGVRIVVDSGFSRRSQFDPRSGLSRLTTVSIDKDAAKQRTGRAGRLSAGVSYRMWSLATQERLAAHRTPEIMESDLSSLILDMAEWGVENIEQLCWLNPPPKGALAQASELLHEIDALEDQKITVHGRRIHQLPCHPRIAHMLLMAEEQKMLGLATDIAALLEERDPLRDQRIDINIRIEALRRHRKKEIQNKSLARIEKIASSYRKLFRIKEQNGSVIPEDSGLLIAQAFPERIAYARPGNNAQFQLANGHYAMASHKDDLAHDPWLAIAQLDARDGMGKIFIAAPLNPKDLAPLVKQVEIVKWDTEDGLIASKEMRIGHIVLQSIPIKNIDEVKKANAICKAIQKKGSHLLDFNDYVLQWQARVSSLKIWYPESDWPNVNTEHLIETIAYWLPPYLNQVKKPEDLKKLNLKSILHYQLNTIQQEQLNKLCPEKVVVPSGSSIKLTYNTNGDAPVLAARIQELFGMADTPKINQNKTAVLIHLLSPGFKPVQITGDLKSFWSDTYFEVRKELKRRYPKHYWPDDPSIAEAIRGVKRKK